MASAVDTNSYVEDLGDHQELMDDPKSSDPQPSAILSGGDIKDRQDGDISQVSASLSLSTIEARVLLHHCNWNPNRAREEWLADEHNLRIAAGLPAVRPARPSNSRKLTCMICFEVRKLTSMATAVCGHQYCVGCLSLRCPKQSCIATVTLDMFYNDKQNRKKYGHSVNPVDIEDRKKYNRYLLRSYVEKSPLRKWCPAPDCKYYIEFETNIDKQDVLCKCLHRFCWQCSEDSHRPVDCETAANWVMKNTSEAGNTQWILSYTKCCPKCKKPIERSGGCVHMVCKAPCMYEFCWMCLLPWEGVEGHIEGFTKCFNYNKSDHQEYIESRDRVRLPLERYTHYFERWASYNKSRLEALEVFRSLKDDKPDVLKKKLIKIYSTLNVDFIIDAWEQIIECRRVLQWTYAYSYYKIEGKEEYKNFFFEYVQGLAEIALEQLHQCVEGMLPTNVEKEEFVDRSLYDRLKLQLLSYTKVARVYFDDMVEVLETSLEDVEMDPIPRVL